MIREKDEVREDRIYSDIVVDAYDDDEVGMSWFYYLDETMTFPFKATMEQKKRDGSKMNVAIEVLSVQVKNPSSWDLRLEVVEQGETKIQRIEMNDLQDVQADEKTIECIEDWRYFFRHEL
jgi:hypothetical protein